MATSGTVGRTVINNAKLLDHAVRRCGLHPNVLTAEDVQLARECLFILATHLSSRGLNLWCLTKSFIGLDANKALYSLPPGTLSVNNLLYATPTLLTGTDSSTATSYTTELDSDGTVVRVGVYFSVAPTTSGFTFDTSPDGAAWTTAITVAPIAVQSGWNYFDVDPSATASWFRVNSVDPITVSEFRLCAAVREVELSPRNRDDYASLSDKRVSGATSTDYFFEKKITPTITLWPVVSTNSDHLVYWRYHQVEDVGTLQNELAIPTRWLETFIVHLAARLAMELPGVDPARMQLLTGLADKTTIEAEADETDGNPVYFSPRISAYTS